MAPMQIGDPETKNQNGRHCQKAPMPASLILQAALGLLALPRDIEPHPETGDMIQAALADLAPILKYQGRYTSLPSEDDVLTVGMNRAVDLLAESAKKATAFWVNTRLADRSM